ncbi:preprotein translocase subunit SecE [Bacillus xiapuensis]|uniref:preprotein translocase subunit SecE n=1 Tax=Bacillus xiapuensis TaxID=2014075 RepID=UPI000C234EEF|nr:preprotein translocase subunit SecE [Bacillus xiapuensis]
MSSLTQFFRNVGTEIRKVSWPKKKELTRYTVTVVTTVVFLSVFFLIVDQGITAVLNWITSK